MQNMLFWDYEYNKFLLFYIQNMPLHWPLVGLL
jgi:hypothetical protein